MSLLDRPKGLREAMVPLLQSCTRLIWHRITRVVRTADAALLSKGASPFAPPTILCLMFLFLSPMQGLQELDVVQ